MTLKTLEPLVTHVDLGFKQIRAISSIIASFSSKYCSSKHKWETGERGGLLETSPFPAPGGVPLVSSGRPAVCIMWGH
jgi:hypothetical protein